VAAAGRGAQQSAGGGGGQPAPAPHAGPDRRAARAAPEPPHLDRVLNKLSGGNNRRTRSRSTCWASALDRATVSCCSTSAWAPSATRPRLCASLPPRRPPPAARRPMPAYSCHVPCGHVVGPGGAAAPHEGALMPFALAGARVGSARRRRQQGCGAPHRAGAGTRDGDGRVARGGAPGPPQADQPRPLGAFLPLLPYRTRWPWGRQAARERGARAPWPLLAVTSAVREQISHHGLTDAEFTRCLETGADIDEFVRQKRSRADRSQAPSTPASQPPSPLVAATPVAVLLAAGLACSQRLAKACLGADAPAD
jgi:hypothetical protein